MVVHKSKHAICYEERDPWIGPKTRGSSTAVLMYVKY